MLLRSLHIASRQLFYLLVVTLIIGLLGLMAAMWLSEEVAKRKDEIAAWASQKTGYPVTIGEAGLYWFDLIPKLEVRQVSLMQKTGDQPVITAGQAYLSLDLLQTFSRGEPVVADASIRQARLAVERGQQGQLGLIGLEKNGNRKTEATIADLTRWFSWLKQLELSDIRLAYTDRKKPGLSGAYQLRQLDLTFAGLQWQAEADVILPEQFGTDLKLSAEAEINKDYTLMSWQGSLETEELSLAPVMSDIALKGLKFDSGLVSGKATALQDQSGNLTAELNLTLTDATMLSERTGEGFDQVVLDRLQGQFSFAQHGTGWDASGVALQIQMAGQDWPQTAFQLNQTDEGEMAAKVDYLRLSDLTSLALLMKEMPEWLVATKPAGDVHALMVNYHPQRGLQSLRLKAADVAMLPWQSYPGANELSFELDWQHDQGELILQTHQATIYADDWLQDAVYLESLTGQVSWREQEGNWHLVAEELNLWNDDLNLSLNGRINHQNDNTDTDLRLDIQDLKANRWREYVPEKIIPEDFEKWSRNAFQEGTIRSGYLEMHGNPAAFPFDTAPAEGSFDMQLEVENTRLHYAEGWPDLTNVSGTISGQGNNLLIKTQSGNIAGFAFREVSTTISNLVRANPILRVDGLLKGNTPDALAFLQNSPLQKRFGSVAEWIQTKGQSDLALELMIPLVNPNATEVSGQVTFVDSQLTTRAIPSLEITAVNGKLDFDNSGVKAEAISAMALNEPIRIDVVPGNEQTRVEIDGSASITSLRALWPEVLPSFVSGESDYQTRVLIAEPEEGAFDVTVNVESDLRGISIDAPAPLGKTASQRKALLVSIEDEGQTAYRINLDNWLNAALRSQDEKLAGEVMLGGEMARPGGSGLRIGGHLETLELDEWLDWQAQIQQDSTATSLPVNTVDLRLEELKLAQQMLQNLHVEASQSLGNWQIRLDSEQVRGDISLPQQLSNDRPLNVRLDYLRLNMPEDESATGSKSKRDLWPAMRLEITEFDINNMQLGQFNLRANRTESSWVVETASLKSPVLQASLTGSWRQSATTDQSQFDIVASSEDLKALLAYYGYQEVIEARQVQLNSQLNWRGTPSDFALATMQGNLDLTVGRGSLIDLAPGAAGRIFGLLSITAIPRRLALDFSDLFGKGFDFSAITGEFQFGAGIARTDNLVMQGDSALIEVAGPVNLVDKTYDQVVKVTPKVSSTLPLAGAVAGGPVGLGVGTAILIFDKLAGTIFDREIVNLISYSYQLTGPWDNPRLNVTGQDAEQGQQLP